MWVEADEGMRGEGEERERERECRVCKKIKIKQNGQTAIIREEIYKFLQLE